MDLSHVGETDRLLMEDVKEKEGKEVFSPLLTKYSIGGKDYEQDLRDLLLIGDFSAKNVLDSKLDEALEKVSYWRTTFLVAYCEAMEERKKYQTQFDLWYADAYARAEEHLRDSRERAIGSIKTWMFQFTHQQVLSELLSDHVDRLSYQNQKAQIAQQESQEYLLKGIWEGLESRGIHLMAIAKRRFEERTNFQVRAGN